MNLQEEEEAKNEKTGEEETGLRSGHNAEEANRGGNSFSMENEEEEEEGKEQESPVINIKLAWQ